MIRRKGPILAVAVIAAFALGWYRGLFGVDEGTPTPAPEAQRQAPAGVETTPPQSAATLDKPDAPTEVAATPEQPQAPAGGVATSEEPQAPVEGATGPDTPEAPVAAATQDPAAAPSVDVAPSVVAQPESQALVEPAPSASPDPVAPGFDVVRVEPDGSTVVAGRGAANERIVLTDGTKTFGETRTDANGDFVMSLSLPTGSHRLQLAQRDDVVSDDAAVVNVPARGRPDQLLVMMERPGEASEVLQRPTEAPVEPATVAQATPASPPEQAEEQMAAVAPTQPATSASETAAETAPTDAAVSVEAVEIEGNRLFVAGSAKGKRTVRIYLDDAFVAESRSGDGDRFIATATVDIPVGDHTIRADALDAAGRVVGRVEVPFQRPDGTSMAAVAPAPGSEAPAASASSSASVADPSTLAATAPAVSAPAPADGATMPANSASGSPEVATAAPGPAVAPVAAGEPEVVKQAPLQAAASRVIIRRGDTLWRISRQTYGRGSRYTVIYFANGDQIRNPDRIYPGQVFRMPSAAEAEAPPRG